MKKVLLTSLTGICMLFACQKQSIQKEPKMSPTIEEKAFKYLSVVHHVDLSKIKYDETMDFVIVDGGYKISVEELITRYNNANVYRETYERGENSEN